MLADEVSHLSTDTYGTVSYMAPELLGQGKFGKPADVYSFGVLSASLAVLPRLTLPLLVPHEESAAHLQAFSFVARAE